MEIFLKGRHYKDNDISNYRQYLCRWMPQELRTLRDTIRKLM